MSLAPPLPRLPADPHAPVAALGFDYGTQRIGVAFGQSVSGSARALLVLKARDGIPDWAQIGGLIEQWQPGALVVGLPYNMDGSESELLARAVKFGKRLHGRFGLPVYGLDERLSSRAASEQVGTRRGTSDRAGAIDHVAAQIILENWFAELAQGARDTPAAGATPERR